ncbi:MAG TPA: hypothetical protein ENI99_03235 [Sedimenticola sp.]|nr:hypothetical protein [Sedimenticola sp.]
MWLLLTWGLTAVLSIYVLRARSYAGVLIAVVSSTLWNVPIIMLGNTASSGLFPVDIIIVLTFFRYFVWEKWPLYLKRRRIEIFIFMLVVVYAAIRTAIAVLHQDYGYYNNFILYGAFRWVLFCIVLLVFYSRPLGEIELFRCLKILGGVLLVYMVFAVLHQQGFVDLSASNATGRAYIYSRSWESSTLFRTYLGSNSATVALIGYAGMLLALFLLRYSKRKLMYFVLFGLSLLVVFGSWSRSDLIAIIVTLGVGGFVWHYAGLIRGLRRYGSWLIGLLVLLIFVFQLEGTVLESKTAERFLGTDYIGQFQGEVVGTGSYRVKNNELTILYWREHLEDAIFGFGPNGYRMLLQKGVSLLNYGHNIYFHIIGELGLIGLVLLALWLVAVCHNIRWIAVSGSPFQKDIVILVSLLLMERLVAGYSVDTIFAVDDMLPTTIILLFFLGIGGGIVKQMGNYNAR